MTLLTGLLAGSGVGSLKQQGFWDASTNTPTLTDGIGTIGYFYIVSVAGTVDFGNGNITFTVGDWVYYNTNSQWTKFETGVAYVPEDIANKATDFSTVNDTLYPSVEAVNEQLATKQDQDNLLDSISTLSGNGIVVRQNANDAQTRSIVAGSSKITISNGDGVSDNPSIDLGTVAISDITSLQSSLDAKVDLAGDTMTGNLSVPKLTATQRIVIGVNRETLSAAKTMVSTDVQDHYLDPNGADRNVTLYASPTTGDAFLFKNIGTANVLTLKNNAGTTLTTIAPNVAVGVEYDGTEWQLI